MLNLKSFKLFDSLSRPNAATIEDVMKLPEYKSLISLGWRDITTERIKKNRNMKLVHPEKPGNGEVSVFANGYIRGYSSGWSRTPYVIKKLESEGTIDDWRRILSYVIVHTLNKVLNLKTRRYSDILSAENTSGLLVNLFSSGSSLAKTFLDMYKESSPETKQETIEAIGMPEEEIIKMAEAKAKASKFLDLI